MSNVDESLLGHIYLRKYDDEFDLCVRSKYNFLVGDSGTGKSYIHSLMEEDKKTGLLHVSGFAPFMLYSQFINKFTVGNVLRHHVIYVDEFMLDDVTVSEFLKFTSKIDCWFIICYRDVPAEVPCSAFDIFKLTRKGHTRVMIPVVPYDTSSIVFHPYKPETVRTILCEDSKSGYYCVRTKFDDKFDIVSSNGKSNLENVINSIGGNVVIYCDLAGLGRDTQRIFRAVRMLPNASVAFTLSFEHDVMKHKKLRGKAKCDWDLYVALDAYSEESYYYDSLCSVFQSVFKIKYYKDSKQSVHALLSDLSWLLPELEESGDRKQHGSQNNITDLCL